MYYKDRIKSLEVIFGTKELVLEPDSLMVNGKGYPIIDDVIILLPPEKYSNLVRKRLQIESDVTISSKIWDFAEDIQYAFGEEWQRHDRILVEHQKEFSQYFDIVALCDLRDKRICDLGCGNGRWSYFLKDTTKEIVLVDFSDAIFVARKNLGDADNCLFFMCDLKELPFKDNFADFLFCIGVLHHLPTPCLDEVHNLKRLAPILLIYLYHAFDNRPIYFHVILKILTLIRLCTCKIRNPSFRKIIVYVATFLVYLPLISLGKLLGPLKLGKLVPLYGVYHGKSIERIKQDVYDTFFVRIEQRVSRKEILKLKDDFKNIIISENLPYWHFICHR